MRFFRKYWIPALLVLVLVLAMGLPVLAAVPKAPEAGNASSEGGEAGLPVEEPAEEPSEGSTEEPTEESAEESAEGPTEEPVEESSEKPTEEVPEIPTEEPVELPEDMPQQELPAEEETTEPYGLVLSEDSIVVSTWAELKKALGEDNGYTTVYLGADITAESGGAPIHAGKPSVVISGSPPGGGRHTLTQYPASGTGYLILVNDTRTVTTGVTLRGMDIVGKNDYGVVWVSDSIPGVTITLEDVNYTGPQALHHRNGTVRFLGGSYTLTGGELAEARHAVLGGALSVEVSAGGNSVLWLTSTASTLRVLENAEVRINTRNYLVYGSIADVTLEAGAGLSLASSWFGFSYAGDSVGTFTLAEQARLEISLNTTESYAALRVSRRFEMMPGSAATIVRTGTAGIPLRLTAAGAQAVFNQPRRVFFYSSAGVPLRFTGAGTLSITTLALNVWSKTAWPLADGMETLPTHIWNKAGSGVLSLSGTYYEAANRGLEHNLAADDPVASQLTAGTFDLNGSQLLAFGATALEVDIATGESAALTGGAASGALLRAGYTLADGSEGSTTGAADAAGRYSLPLSGGALLEGSGVSVIACSNQLYIRQGQTVRDASRYTLSFSSVPAAISFGALQIPGGQNTAAPVQSGLGIAVRDNRLVPSPWRIDALLERPMSAQVGQTEHLLPGALLFGTGDGGALALNELPQTVYRHSGGVNGETVLEWGGGSGPMLDMVPGQVYSGAEYTAVISWLLVDAP